MRCFFALDIPLAMRTELLEAARTLRAISGSNLRVLPEENLHLTLRFIENLPASDLEGLCERAASELSDCDPFEVTVRGYGAFPHGGKARVFWAGIEDPDKRLDQLAIRLERAAEAIGMPREKRRFRAHITLARLKRPAPLPLEALTARLPTQLALPLSVDTVTLYESRTDPTGAVYTALADFPVSG